MPEWLKVALLIPIYALFAPSVGLMLRSNRTGQRIIFFLMLFFTILHYRLISTSP